MDRFLQFFKGELIAYVLLGVIALLLSLLKVIF